MPSEEREPLTILELGSGTGIIAARVSKALAPQRDRFIATDLADVCVLLESNLKAESLVSVESLAWGSEENAMRVAETLNSKYGERRYLTHILCSDLVWHLSLSKTRHLFTALKVYFPTLHGSLLRTLLHLTSDSFVGPSAQPQIIVSYMLRSHPKELPFWSAFGLWFSFTPVLCRKSQGPWERFSLSTILDQTEDWNQVFVFTARRRPESLGWIVPRSDEALLAGAGARGTCEGKSDDTFEEILLMGVDFMIP